MVSALDDLLIEQDEIAGRIERFLINLRKMGKNNITLTVLETRRELLEDYWKTFLLGHRCVIREPEASTKDYIKNDRFADVEEVYLQHSATLRDMQRELEPDPARASTGDFTSGSADDHDFALPKLSLPTFSGDLLAWESFRDRFRSLIHDSTRISKVRKLEYLKSALTGEAATMLERTNITAANYDGAWSSLQKRYENQRILSAERMRSLVNCAPVTKACPTDIKRLLDEFRQAIVSFTSLKRPVAEWDEWFVFLFAEKLDSASRLDWEITLTDRTTCPTFSDIEDFFENRVHALYAAHNQEPTPPSKQRDTKGRPKTFDRSRTALPVKAEAPPKRGKPKRQCQLCQGTHNLNYCPKFKGMSAVERKAQAIKVGVCLSCLNLGHIVSACPSAFRCLVCDSKHHTLLHDAYMPSEVKADINNDVNQNTTAKALVNSICAKRLVLLATARVRLLAPNGRFVSVRAVLDQGADASFVSEWVAQTLRLRKRSTHVKLAGFQGRDVGTAKYEVEVILTSDFNSSFKLPFHALVTREVMPPTPSRLASENNWPHLTGLQLADAEFHTPSRVDILLGADVCSALVGETRQGPRGAPAATHTPFGWVLFGPASSDADVTDAPTRRVYHTSTQDPISAQLQRFWELEDVQETSPLSPEELWCEEYFQTSHQRNEIGRYVVRLPFHPGGPKALGSSRSAALRVLLHNERRQQKDPVLRNKYCDFLVEYLQLEHMEPVQESSGSASPLYYLPHHAVWKGEGEKRKIRVVFNASCTTSSGFSLNDLLSPGPKLQASLWSVLTRWRLFQFAFSADIVKMFRQILVHSADRDWQCIMWRADPTLTLSTFRLNTVTYGTACAPFLALRVLRQLAQDEKERFPLGSQVLLEHSYVDDLLAGGHDLEQAREVQRQLIEILNAGGFQLSKWATNHELLVPLETSERSKLFQESDQHGALGLLWMSTSDTLCVKGPGLNSIPDDASWTKRMVLSELARLFDPMGWVAPVLVRGKILMQDLWLAGVDWDERIPPPLTNSWNSFRQDLQSLDGVRVPRWISYDPTESQIEFHGFCDASERAYCAVVYLRVHNPHKGFTHSHILVARTKVAPVKVISVPRLELCGAVLLARLLTCTRTELGLPDAGMNVWTDSSVVHTWTRAHASRWKTFVAHRVAEIQNLLPDTQWRHVRTQDNPADLATRGVDLPALQGLNLWWQGPPWLTRNQSEWPTSSVDLTSEADSEQRSNSIMHTVCERTHNELLSRYSTFSRLLRVTALIQRFVFNLQNATRRRTGHLTSTELTESRILLCRLSQLDTFPEERDDLLKGKSVRVASPLAPLRAFIDDQGLIRVGGRLSQAALPVDHKFPIVISRYSPLALLLARYAHLTTLHGGFTLSRCLLLQRYWIPKCRTLLKTVIHNCLQCLRFRGVTGHQQMGSLPLSRLQPSRPFLKSGVDYAGPLMLRTTKGRGHKSYKGYVAVFVCLCTKAVHLEVVSDLTSTSFLASFRRFVSRRGHCAELLSDNATTFRGAHGELRSLFKAASSFYGEVSATLAMDGTQWSFIPPYSPHFGGLWEAAVKSAKYHLRRVIGEHTLTYEEMATLLCQVEACLNSRPLTSMSDDPSDLTSLTPGHFLVGEPLISIPEPNCANMSVHGLTRWKLISNLRDHFWLRWTKEYLHQLQQLPKWRRHRLNWKVGDLVLVKDALLPPTKWPLARILEVHPGKDDLVRVVTIRSSNKTSTRSIGTLCPLPEWTSTDLSTTNTNVGNPASEPEAP